MEEKHKKRIGNLTFGLMVALAIILDIISIIPGANIIVDIVAALVFGLWFMLRGVGFVNPRRFSVGIIAIIIELVPFLSILPGITAGVVITILSVRTEDRLGIHIPSPTGKKLVRAGAQVAV